MKIIIKSALAIIIAVSLMLAQTSDNRHYWIVLSKKEKSSSKQFSPQSLGITERSLKRRAKALPPDRLIDDLDLPVSESAIVQIKQTGAKIRSVSRWFNAVSVEASTRQIQTLKTLPIVAFLEQVVIFKRSQPLPGSADQSLYKSTQDGTLSSSGSIGGIDYGSSLTQLSNMKVVDLHAIGVNGTGVLIGMLDDGFNNYRAHAALKDIRVIATYNFIHNIEDVTRQPWENTIQGNHGAGTLSLAGGFANGALAGSAYGASFLLAKTEMDSSGSTDFHSEEDTYVAALEWAERLGVDITSSSLGYKEFSTPPFYTTTDLNGRTTKVAQAALIAARKNVLVVTAMGNDGSKGKVLYKDSTLVSPADADSIIAVGATSSDGELAVFSGCGPTADGRIKPEVVAQGMDVYWANGYTTTGYSYANGTSCATPLVAGAAALILSAHPNLTNMQVRQALLETAKRTNYNTTQTAIYPNNYYGYGFVDAYEAALSLGPLFSNAPKVIAIDSKLMVTIFIVPKKNIPVDLVSLHYSINGSAFEVVPLQSTSTLNEFKCIIPRFSSTDLAVGYFTMRDSAGQDYRFPPEPQQPDTLKPNTLQSDTLVKLSITPPLKYELLQNYPNPFNNGTILTFDVPSEENIDITVFNILGQNIKTIYSGRPQIGTQTVRWDGTNERGCRVGTGVYIARLKTSKITFSKKMLYVK